jgi:hypothetical protein
VCSHIALIPESASIVFGGGFWRRESLVGRKAAQRAIYHVQNELERMVREEGKAAAAICDRGTVDGVAYWPEDPNSFFRELGTTRNDELSRYSLVIHLRTPSDREGYNHVNPLRVETAAQARAADDRILKAWEGHPRRVIIDSTHHFLEKARRVIELVEQALPHCCRKEARLGALLAGQ